MNTSRRDFMKFAGITSAAVMLGAAAKGEAQAAQKSMAAAVPVSMEHCQAMTPFQMAQDSPMISQSWTYLQDSIAKIQSAEIRNLTSSIYQKPEPLLAERLDAQDRKQVWQELKAKNYTEQSEQDFLPPAGQAARQFTTLSAPGSGYGSHHSYPGGLVTHVATNVFITFSIVDAYKNIYGYNVDADVAVASQLLHDLHKPYVFQWQENASSRTEQKLAGTGEHHVLSLAELLVRKAPADLVVAQSCAHTPPSNANDEQHVVNWLKAAAIIAGVDPIAYGLLDKSGETLPLPRKQEGFLCHLGDHDFVLSVPVVQWTLPVMKKIATQAYNLTEKDLDTKVFHSLRNMVYSRISAMRLENILAHQGEEGVKKAMLSIVKA